MIVMKFGGTSVANAEAIEGVLEIVSAKMYRHPVVVVSAFAKVTDALYGIADLASSGQQTAAQFAVDDIQTRHVETLAKLIPVSSVFRKDAEAAVSETCGEIREIVDEVCHIGRLSDRNKVRIISSGEYLSSAVIYNVMKDRGMKVNYVDARRMIVTNDNFMKGEPDMPAIMEKVPYVISKAMESSDMVITQGFVSESSNGMPTVLGRGGSDYTASIIGMAAGADEIEIWTDVDGVRTADPRRIDTTRSLRSISFEEASEMSHFGARVLHPSTIEPAVNRNIPIKVLNSFNPGHEGTLIVGNPHTEPGAKSISFKENIVYLDMIPSDISSTPGFSAKVLEALGRCSLKVDLISMSESKVSVTMEDSGHQLGLLKEMLSFADISIERSRAQISVVGKDLVNISGLCKTVLDTMSGFKVYMIMQGTSSNSISFVVDRDMLHTVLKLLHKRLFEDEDCN